MLRLFRLLGCGSCLPCGSSSSSSQFPEPVQSSFLPADQSAKRAGLKLGPQFPRLALNPLESGDKEEESISLSAAAVVWAPGATPGQKRAPAVGNDAG